MRIIPAVDILDGNVVRLKKGDFGSKTIYSVNPKDTVAKWFNEGACLLHVVDLNGSKGEDSNMAIIQDIVEQFSNIQLAGGIRDLAKAQRLLNEGVQRVVIGTAAAKLEPWVRDLLAITPHKVVIALDVRDKLVRTNGWLKNSGKHLPELIDTLCHWGANNFLVTDIAQDGMGMGPNFLLYQDLLHINPQINLIASGGVSSVADIRGLDKIGVSEVVIGRAFYEMDIDFLSIKNSEIRRLGGQLC